jgi:hypothetical protein
MEAGGGCLLWGGTYSSIWDRKSRGYSLEIWSDPKEIGSTPYWCKKDVSTVTLSNLVGLSADKTGFLH